MDTKWQQRREKPMRVVGKGTKAWKSIGVGSGDAAALFNCHSGGKTVLDLWAEIVGNRDQKELKRMRKVNLDQGTGEWLDWRKLGIGGSEVGCVMGANAYSGSQAPDIWGRKLPEDHPGFVPEVADNPAMRQGREREPLARERYEQLFGWSVEPVCVLHDEYDFIRCSLDGCRDDGKVIVEIKCSMVPNHRKYLAVSKYTDPFERQVAYARTFPSYRYQILYQMLITGAERCHFCAFNSDMRDPADQFVTFDLYPEPRETERLLERCKEFWSFVESRSPPPPEWCEPIWKLPELDDLKIPGA